MCDVLQECLSRFLKIESFGTGANQSIGIASHRQWCSCDSASRLWKELNLSSVLFGKAFRLDPEWEHVSTFAPQHQVNSIVEEQFCKYELTELGLSALHLKDWTRLSIETERSLQRFCCYQQTWHRSLMTEIWNFATTFKFKLTNTAKKSLQDASFAVFFSKLLKQFCLTNKDTHLTAWFCPATWRGKRFHWRHLLGLLTAGDNDRIKDFKFNVVSASTVWHYDDYFIYIWTFYDV